MNYFTIITFFLALTHSTIAGYGNGNQPARPSLSVVPKGAKSGSYGSYGGYNKPKNDTTALQCVKLNALQQLVSIANNATAMAKLPAAEQTRVKMIAANVTAQLTTLQSNTTLVTMCRVEKECEEINRLQTWSTILSNATDVQKIEAELASRDHKSMNLTITEVNAFKANVTARLNTLMTNTTLVNECKAAVPGASTTATTSIQAGATATTAGAIVKATTNAAVSSMQGIGTGAFAMVFFLAPLVL